MTIDELITELEIYAKILEAQGNILLAAKTEMLIIQMKKEKNHVS
jgi:hypothetical protein